MKISIENTKITSQKENFAVIELTFSVVEGINDLDKAFEILSEEFKNFAFWEVGKSGSHIWIKNANGERLMVLTEKEEKLEKGESLMYLGFEIKMCSNNDGIVLLSPDGEHCGNFGTDSELAKRYALIRYMMSKRELRSTLVSRLAHIGKERAGGYYGDHTLLMRHVKNDGFDPIEVPICGTQNNMIDFGGNKKEIERLTEDILSQRKHFVSKNEKLIEELSEARDERTKLIEELRQARNVIDSLKANGTRLARIIEETKRDLEGTSTALMITKGKLRDSRKIMQTLTEEFVPNDEGLRATQQNKIWEKAKNFLTNKK